MLIVVYVLFLEIVILLQSYPNVFEYIYLHIFTICIIYIIHEYIYELFYGNIVHKLYPSLRSVLLVYLQPFLGHMNSTLPLNYIFYKEGHR